MFFNMFSNKCPKCNNKIKKDYEFCPFCGNNLNSQFDKQDYGMIGKNDFIKETEALPFSGSPFESLISRVMKDAMKMIKESNETQNNQNNNSQPIFPNNFNVQFFVNGKKMFPSKPGNQPNNQANRPIKIINEITPEKKEKISKLPREEPNSIVRRISGKVIYQFAVPGVENIEDILINQLENSIEVKAISNDKVYLKTLNIKLPIVGYDLKEGNLFLELQG